MRVYELAKSLGLSSPELLKILENSEFSAKSHMSVLSQEAVQFIQKSQQDKKTSAKPSVSRLAEEPSQKKNLKNSAAGSKVVAPEVKEEIKNTNPAQEKIKKEDNIETQQIRSQDLKKSQNHKTVEFKKDSDSSSSSAKALQGAPVLSLKPKSAVVDEEDVFDKDDVVEGVVDEDEDGSFDYNDKRSIVSVKAKKTVGVQEGARRRSRKKFKTARTAAQRQSETPAKIDFLDTSAPIIVVDLAKMLAMTVQALVLFFVKKAKFYSANDLVPVKDLEIYAPEWGVEIAPKSKNVSVGHQVRKDSSPVEVLAKDLEPRAPVVVVMGHVDHGKTTLIDYIRNSNIAAKEKGGITQSIRVHEATVSNGKIIIIDTPGHEAFSAMRKVGAGITDIAIIIVAADDGVMPQTVESIKTAKEMGATIVVAINKVDKPGVTANVDKIKQNLAQYDIIVEDWGGDVVCVPISAKTGQGVTDLLEMVALQAELLNITTSKAAPMKAFVLESFVERGLGACAIAILKQGTLAVGEFVYTDNVTGKVKALSDMTGKKIAKVGPYQPVKIIGLSEVAKTGDFVYKASAAQISSIKDQQEKLKANLISVAQSVSMSNMSQGAATSAPILRLILKADGFGSLDALVNLVANVCKKNPKFAGTVQVIEASVGDIYEKDAILAKDTSAVILGMNVNIEKNAAEIIRQNKTEFKIDSIIYRLSDLLEETLIGRLKQIKHLKQVGRGFVKKVFDIKGKGIIAGCGITEGMFIDKGVVHCIRNDAKVGEGRITSLQQERKTMKEIPAGQECGFVCQGFSGWQEGDRVICFQEYSAY